MGGAVKRFGGDRRGVIGLEFGLLALPLVVLLFGAFELGMTLKTRAALQYGAELAARCAAVTPTTCGTSAQVQAHVAPRLGGVAVPANAFTLMTAGCGKLVTVSMTYQGATSNLLPRPVVLSGRSCYPV